MNAERMRDTWTYSRTQCAVGCDLKVLCSSDDDSMMQPFHKFCEGVLINTESIILSFRWHVSSFADFLLILVLAGIWVKSLRWNEVSVDYTVSKNDTALACYNFHKHRTILIIFGCNAALKVSSQVVLYFPTSPN